MFHLKWYLAQDIKSVTSRVDSSLYQAVCFVTHNTNTNRRLGTGDWFGFIQMNSPDGSWSVDCRLQGKNVLITVIILYVFMLLFEMLVGCLVCSKTIAQA